MPKKLNTESFVRKAREKHGDKYDYSKSVYTKCSEKVIIICPYHGEFSQRPSNHLQGCGCPKCDKAKRELSSKVEAERFIHRAQEVHGDLYDYSKSIYVNAKEKITIICPKHGGFDQLPSNHLRGWGCKKCGDLRISGNTNDFIKKADQIHNNFYDYSKSVYINQVTPVVIICPIHGEFQQIPSTHVRGTGCPKCACVTRWSKLKRTTLDFINDAREVHGEFYDYSKSVYSFGIDKVIIICSEHGEFSQVAKDHLSGAGCPKCGLTQSNLKLKERAVLGGWGMTSWDKIAKKSKYFDSFKVYIIKCWSEETGEEFYKIGRTFLTVENRFCKKKHLPYYWDAVETLIYNNARDAFYAELRLQNFNKEFQYIPKIEFAGRYECFSQVDFSKIKEELCY